LVVEAGIEYLVTFLLFLGEAGTENLFVFCNFGVSSCRDSGVSFKIDFGVDCATDFGVVCGIDLGLDCKTVFGVVCGIDFGVVCGIDF